MKKIKPWSISTTVRNPYRMRDFLLALDSLSGKTWDKKTQIAFQIELIRRRYYGVGSTQFSKDLSAKSRAILESNEDLSLRDARQIFDEKAYKDPPMRGRTSFKPLQKFGFCRLTDAKKLQITASGQNLLAEDSDFSDILLRSLVKWQLPNPIDKSGFSQKDGHGIKPFVATLHLISKVNALCKEKGEKEKGISFFEFGLFANTLIDYRAIEQTAQDIMQFRTQISALPKNRQDAYLQNAAARWRPNFVSDNIRDYADNAVRYFRATGFINIRGAGYYIDIEPMRQVEIESLLALDTGQPNADINYGDYIADPQLPELPWETPQYMTQSALAVIEELSKAGQVTRLPSGFETMALTEQKATLQELRALMQERRKEADKNTAKNPQEIRNIAANLRALMDKKAAIPNRPTYLEYWTALALLAINDALTIQPNYPLGDDGMPMNTAPAGKADIECHYKSFKMVCEVTLTRDRLQWVQEGQPVVRHTHDFAKAHPKAEVFCLFIAPFIHVDTANTFWGHIKTGYEAQKMQVVPMTIADICEILEFCAQCYEQEKTISNKKWKELFASAVHAAENHASASQWAASIGSLIQTWKARAV